MNRSTLLIRSISNLLAKPLIESYSSKSTLFQKLSQSRKLTSTTSPDSLNGLLNDIPFNNQYHNYPRLTARQTALRTAPPKEAQMLVRDFIDDSLYNPNYGYFSKQAVIFSPQYDIDFSNIKDNLEFMNLVASKYEEFENSLNDKDKKVAKQIWHTSTELFKPWYGYAFAKYIVNEYKLGGNPQHDLIIYELGAGNGTLMLNILDYIQKFEPAIYKKTRYRVVEISSMLAERQKSIQNFHQVVNVHNCVEIINKNIFDWDEPVDEPCFFLACEVLDNFAHDVIRYNFSNEKPVQGIVVSNERGEYQEIYEPVNDPLIMRYLSLRNKTMYKTPALQKRILRLLRNKLPLAPNLTQPEFIPTKLLLFLDILKEYFPKHRLVISDFYKLPDSIQGIDAPVVQTRYQHTMIPCSTYMVHPGWFDIFFPTNFELMKDIYQLVCRSGRAESEKIKVLQQKEFLKRYADLTKTQTKSGENPMLITKPKLTTIPITVSLPPSNFSENPKEKFLTYLPHNGFNNQRDALINAIMLSYITNRTLLMPPILINYYPQKTTFHPLYDALNEAVIAKKYRKEHCYKDDYNDGNDANIFSPHSFCDNSLYSKYDEFNMLNWDQVFDLSEIKKHVKMINRGYDFSLEGLKYNFNIGDDDTHLFIENINYEFEFFDNDKSIRRIHENFEKKFLISDLIKVDKKLLHFTSLYNINKIVLENQDNMKFRQFIHNKLMINEPNILNISNGIIKKLGGKGNYVGIHLRAFDGFFKAIVEYNKELLFTDLMKYLVKSDLLRKSKKFFKYNLEECVANNVPIVYIASDSKDPKLKLRKFYKSIPCVFSLIDFTKDFENIAFSSSDYDEGTDLKSFYVPVIDLLVAAHGNAFFGTPKSAFSMAGVEINNLYHGKDAIPLNLIS
ncbi:hypothetical protein RclHR1_02430013 [Rhizophagus clarus]|uniref:type II protein arginine methyltransferase n=1 Tax=Rhizophagus clarus TaxID=94130 RepID=A0A2Z6R238_9GLOM|nr:hypothetical protein RclHR1_02430013 [Rhizophagus clarus]